MPPLHFIYLLQIVKASTCSYGVRALLLWFMVMSLEKWLPNNLQKVEAKNIPVRKEKKKHVQG